MKYKGVKHTVHININANIDKRFFGIVQYKDKIYEVCKNQTLSKIIALNEAFIDELLIKGEKG